MIDIESAPLKISSAFRKREYLASGKDTTAYRLFNGNCDGIPGLIVDRYDRFLLLQIYESHVTPHVRDFVEIITRDPLMEKYSIAGILRKNREESAVSQNDYRSECVWGSAPEGRVTVMQSGVLVEVDLISGLNTGLFLDMRSVREYLVPKYRELSSVLNLFCYTGVFSVHALRHGVKRVSNVDISNTVLRRAKRNYEINGFDIDERDFISEDAGRLLGKLVKRGIGYDMVIFDPPTFARNKQRTFSIRKDYPSYLEMIGEVSRKYVLSVINTYSIGIDEYRSYHPKQWSLETIMHESDDFTSGDDNYLKAGLWRINSR